MSVQLTPIQVYLNKISAENKPLTVVYRNSRFKQTAIDKVRDFILKVDSWTDWATWWLRTRDIANEAIHTYISERSDPPKNKDLEDMIEKIAKPRLFPELTRKNEEFHEKIFSFLEKTANSHRHSEKLPPDVDYWSYEMGQIGSKYKELIDAYDAQQLAEASAQNISA